MNNTVNKKEEEPLPVINSNNNNNVNNSNTVTENTSKGNNNNSIVNNPEINIENNPVEIQTSSNKDVPSQQTPKIEKESSNNLLNDRSSTSFPRLPSESLTEISDSHDIINKLDTNMIHKQKSEILIHGDDKVNDQLAQKSKSVPIIKNNNISVNNNSTYGK